MKKKFFNFFYTIFFGVVFSTNSFQLVLPIIPTKEIQEKTSITAYYRGNIYKAEIKNLIGNQLNIEDKDFNQKIFILIAEKIKIVKSLSGENIKGLKVEDGSEYLFFEANLIVTEDANRLAYTWEMKNLEIGDFCIPENTLILNVPISSVNIENNSKNLFINMNSSEVKFPSLIFLPAIYIDLKKFSKSDFSAIDSIPDMKKIHTPKNS